MHRLLRAACIGIVAVMTSAAAPAPKQGPAIFDWFDYRATNEQPAPGPGEYGNPILQGFYPDPSIVRVGNDFYLVNSTFSWFPGIPVFHSRDLVHWTQISNAIDQPGQLDFAKIGMSRGVFAPAISWHDGTFYIINTCVDCGGNFIITARDPHGPWSDPVWFEGLEGAIDPSIFFDTDGTAWIVNNGPPAGAPRYEGHRAIWLQQFDPKSLKTFGPRRVLVDAGVHPDENPAWIEGPHIFRRGEYYYLIAAEGGTGPNHSEVVFRSKQVTGPYVPWSENPILTQRDLPKDRPLPITSTGHADFVETPSGEWWSIFLGSRPYSDNLYNTGRETFLMPVHWQDGWPRITNPGEVIPWTLKRPDLPPQPKPPVPTSGSFEVRDDFAGAKLPFYWMMMRNPQGQWWALANGSLRLQPRPVGIGHFGNPSLLGRRQQHLDATATTAVRFDPASDDAEAGLVALQSDEFWYALLIGREKGKRVIRLRRRAGPDEPANGVVLKQAPLSAPATTPVQLRITARGANYDFGWSADGKSWHTLVSDADGTILSTEKAGGFVGAMIGMYAHDGEAKAQ